MQAGNDDAQNGRTGPRLRLALIAVLALGLSGCGGISLLGGGGGPPPRLYDLSPKSTFEPAIPEVSWQLVVEEPFAPSAISTDRVAVRTGPFEFAYYEGVRWSDRAPRMVQTLLVESFENSGKITAVGRQAIGLRSDFELKTELREFQALMSGGQDGAPLVWVRMNFKMVAQPSAQIIALQTFDSRVQAADDRMSSIVMAFDEALGDVMKDGVAWTLTTGERHDRSKR